MSVLLARPDQSLRAHHASVAEGMAQIVSQTRPVYNPLVSEVGNDRAKELLRIATNIMAVCHDFGKASPYFQKMIRSEEKLPPSERPLSYHTETGALLCLHVLPRFLKDTPAGLKKRLTGMCVCAILQHHTPSAHNIRDTWHALLDGLDTTCKILALIEQQVNKGAVSFEMVFPQPVEELTAATTELLGMKKEQLLALTDTLDECIDAIETAQCAEDYVLYRLMYSALCDMDEFDAGFHDGSTGSHTIERDLKRSRIDPTIVDHYRMRAVQNGVWTEPSSTRATRMKQLREDTYTSSVEALSRHQGIVSLQAPTGSGKTLALLSLAVKSRDMKEKETGIAPRLIYALPFISIAEQVEQVIRQVFEIPQKGGDDVLTVHHSLAEPAWNHDNEQTYDSRRVIAFADRWRTDMVVTTMVRLWDTILGPSKQDSARFNRLAGSIIIMDEVQSVPVKYWSLVSEMIRTLQSELGCTVILATATMPAILERGEAHTIAVNDEEVNRYQLHYRPSPLQLEDFVREVLDSIRERPSSDILVVLNTKKSAAHAFSAIRAELGSHDLVYFLSGLVAPVHRSQTIQAVRDALRRSDKRVVLVCTQVVEAGVDLSFDLVFRDFAPLDSIVQVAGRCNRSWEHEALGLVCLRNVVEGSLPFSSMVYDHVDLEMAREALGPDEVVYVENELRMHCREYLSGVKSRKPHNAALRPTRRLELKSLGKDFSLIEERAGGCDAFVDLDKESHVMLSRVREGLKRGRVSVPPGFYRYVIRLSAAEYDTIKDSVEEVADYAGRFLFCVLDAQRQKDLYSPDNGLLVD